MRFFAIPATAALLLMPAAGPAAAAGAVAQEAGLQTVTDFSAAKKKPKKAKKQPREKVEFMRAVPSGPPAAR
jgi:hypothetical protein